MEYILETKNLKKYYGQEPNITRALDGVDVQVERGEFVSIIGTVSYTHLRAHET